MDVNVRSWQENGQMRLRTGGGQNAGEIFLDRTMCGKCHLGFLDLPRFEHVGCARTCRWSHLTGLEVLEAAVNWSYRRERVRALPRLESQLISSRAVLHLPFRPFVNSSTTTGSLPTLPRDIIRPDTFPPPTSHTLPSPSCELNKHIL